MVGNRHNRLAPDSRIMSCVVPKSLFDSLNLMAKSSGLTFSDVTRRALFIGEGILRKRVKSTEDER